MAGCSSAGEAPQRSEMMFHMKNRFDVYLHDTPSKNLFGRDDRRFSHGCIRVEDPRKLAALLMRQPIEAIDESIATGSTNWRSAEARAGIRGVRDRVRGLATASCSSRADIYGRDAEICAVPRIQSGERWRNARRPTNASVHHYSPSRGGEQEASRKTRSFRSELQDQPRRALRLPDDGGADEADYFFSMFHSASDGVLRAR